MITHLHETADEAWREWYSILSKQDLKQPSRAGEVCGEILNAITVISNPRKNIIAGRTSVEYAVGELLWYLSGSNRLEDIKPYSKFWKKISDDGETLNSAYGYRIYQKFGFDQWEQCKKLLKNDPYSRQAYIHIKDADNAESKDVPCTIGIQYLLRENKLHSTVYMRSNDLWLGFPYNVFIFTCFQIKMAMELGVGLGEYTHIAGSLHLYKKNLM